MKPQGSLAEHDFPELIHGLSEGRWTGLLTLTHMGVGRSVTVQQGRMVFAASTSTDDRLGEMLFRHGRISLRQHTDAGAAVVSHEFQRKPHQRLDACHVDGAVFEQVLVIERVVLH